MRLKNTNVCWVDGKGIETYRVGFFADLWILWYELRNNVTSNRKDLVKFRIFFRRLKRHWRNKSYWNGYLAEFHYPPDGLLHYKCGHGWTRKRALKRLGWHYIVVNLSETEFRRWTS